MEALIGFLGGAGGLALIGFLRDLWRGRRTARASDAKVAMAEIGERQAAYKLLAAEIEDLREEGRRERAECREEMAQLRQERDECKQEVADLRALVERLQTRLNRVLSWMRTDPSEREDLTPVETPAKRGT